MKKLHLLVWIFISVFTFISTSNGISANLTKGSTVSIKINDIRRPAGSGTPTPRSVISLVDTWYDADMALLEISFNEEVGKVSIQVQNSFGQVVSSCSVDTTYEPMVMMNVPTNEDYYTIHIVGDIFEAYGAYNL